MKNGFVVELSGRIGNQLFEFAAGYALALDYGSELSFFPAMVRDENNSLPELLGPLYREASLAETIRFGRIGGEPISLTGRRQSRRHLVDLVGRTTGSYLNRRTGWPHIVYEEETTKFEPSVLASKPGSLLVGHFQSEKYFARHAAAVQSVIRLAPVPSEFTALPRPIVAVSFRRGDYTERNWTLSLDYYARALDALTKEVTPGSILAFSDDEMFSHLSLGWLEQFGPAHDAAALDPTPMAQLAMLSESDHHVLANSTFSWWGGWLAEQRSNNAGHITIAPGGWAHGAHDVIPDRWRTIPG